MMDQLFTEQKLWFKKKKKSYIYCDIKKAKD